ncbi:MAG: hypothetical protein OEY23_08475 [Acidimicrobiia bacterium]|nr:hypothetical protein [Acidimicrobiia bacterium]
MTDDAARAIEVGRTLAAEHAVELSAPSPAGAAPASHRLVAFAEAEREPGGWSLRSALVRYAQAEPVRASAVLEQVRRVDGALAAVRTRLERETVGTDPALGPASFDEAGRRRGSHPSPGWPDARLADLARLVHRWPEGAAGVLEGYGSVCPLREGDAEAVAVLAVAVELDELGDELAAWAVRGQPPMPNEVVDRRVRAAFDELERLGVARESGDVEEWRRAARARGAGGRGKGTRTPPRGT